MSKHTYKIGDKVYTVSNKRVFAANIIGFDKNPYKFKVRLENGEEIFVEYGKTMFNRPQNAHKSNIERNPIQTKILCSKCGELFVPYTKCSCFD